MAKEKNNYIIVFQAETDGPMFTLSNLTIEEINSMISNHNLTEDDYAIIEGRVVKSFNSKNHNY